jgi:hypothetical protein
VGNSRHFPTGLGTAAADLGARRQVRLLSQLIALVSAPIADGGTGLTGMGMQFRAPDHEIGAHAANLGAIE